MRCGVIARKLGMSRIFNDKGEHVPVTVLRLEDVEVLSTRSIKNDGYIAVQLGFNNKKLDKDLKQRRKLLEAYKMQIANLKKKLKDDVEKEEDEKSIE